MAEKVTEEALKKWTDDQFRLGLSTDESDWDTFKRSIRKLYNHLGLSKPLVFKVRSPMVGALAEYYLFRHLYEKIEVTGRKNLDVHMIHRPVPQLESSLSVQAIKLNDLARKKAAKIMVKIRVPNPRGAYPSTACMPREIIDFLDNIRSSGLLTSSYRSTVDFFRLRSMLTSIGGVIATSVYRQNGTNNIAQGGWLGMFFDDFWAFSYFNQESPRKYLYEAYQNVWMFLPSNGFVIACDRPKFISTDRNGVLHNNDQMAVKYRDGWGIYAIHGVIVPAKYVERTADEINPRDIFREENSQVRMAVISKIGFHRILKNISYKVIDRGLNGRDELIQMDIDGHVIRVLHVHWREADGEHETCIPVPATYDQFANVGPFVPDDINNFEDVRWWTFKLRRKDIKIMGES